MKPLHVALLVAGAAIAGGLAVRMSQPPALQVSASSPAPAPPPALVRPVAAPVHTAPAPVIEASVTAAPAPVYTDPAPKPRPFREVPKKIEKSAPMPINPIPYQPPPVKPAEPVVTPTPAPAPAPEPEPIPLPAPEPRRVTLHQGMQISARLNESLSTDRAAVGDTFQASLADPLVVDGLVIAERGARLTGRVVNTQKGRIFSSPQLELALLTVETSDGQRVSLSTEPWVIKAANLPSDSVTRFRLAARVTITEKPL